MDVTIPKSEYDNLVKQSSQVETLKADVEKYQEESKNKGIALEESRKKLDEQKKSLKADLDVEKEKLKTISEKLWLKEDEDIWEKLEALKESDTKYSEILEQEKKDRAERISSYREKLWEEFMEDKKDLFEGLSEEKQETLLKEFMDAKGLWDDNWGDKPKVWVHKDGKDPSDNKKSDFDKLNASGASAQDLINALD